MAWPHMGQNETKSNEQKRGFENLGVNARLDPSQLANVGAGLQYLKQRRKVGTATETNPTEEQRTKKRKKDSFHRQLQVEDNTIEIVVKRRKVTQRNRRRKEMVDQNLNAIEENRSAVDENRRNEVAKISLWNADTHMFLWGRLNRCLGIFESTSLTLVHPAVVDPTNVKNYFASWVEGSGATASFLSPLSFNITVAIAQGAQAAGDKELEGEYWIKARNQAGALFDIADFHVATGLLRLSECAKHRGLTEQAAYYAQLSLAICESLNIYNSLLYTWSAGYLFLGASLSIFQQKTRKAKALPYLTQMETDLKLRDTLSTPSSTSSPSYTTLRSVAGYNAQESIDDEKIEKYGTDMQLDSVFQELLVGITNLYSEAIPYLEDPPFLMNLEGQLDELNVRWEAVKHVFRKPQQIKMDSIFTLVATLLGWVLKKEGKALSAAIEFFQLAEDPTFSYLPLLQRPVYYPLKVLLETGNTFLLYRLLSILRHLNGGTFLDTPLLEEFKSFLQEA